MLTVEPCGELRASLGWMGFAASSLEPLLAPVCTPSPLQASSLTPAHLSLLAAAPSLGHPALPGCSRVCIPSQSFPLHRCRTKFFLCCPMQIRTSLYTLPPTARPERGQLGEELGLTLVTEDFPFEGLPQVTCPCSPAQVCVWTVELGPHQVKPCIFAHILGLSQQGLEVQPHGGTQGSCHRARATTDGSL